MSVKISVGDFTPQELELSSEIAEVVGANDWFLRSVIDGKRRSLVSLVSQRIQGDRDRFLEWKRAAGIGHSGELDGGAVLHAIANHVLGASR